MTDDADVCRRIVRAHARTFWLASRFLPPRKRRAAFALYAFCREADDLVDAGVGRTSALAPGTLPEYRALLSAALLGRPATPVFRELVHAVQQFGVPRRVLDELLEGVSRDRTPGGYETWDDLTRYCEGVASSVGEMCAYVFGVAGDSSTLDRALAHARTLGVAMQLTNILRDVGEDARAGRCYLPERDLAAFDLSRADVLRGGIGEDPRWQALMRFQIARARQLYADAIPGIALLAADSRRCAAACAYGYAEILVAIEAVRYDTFRVRATVGAAARMGILWQVWRTTSRVGVSADSGAPPRPKVADIVRWA